MHFFIKYKLPLILLLLSSGMFLYNLQNPVIRQWDEAGYALNALEMLQTKNWFIVTHFFEPDLYNSKPPAGLWPMALSIFIFGFNEFAIRLPSALMAIASCMLIYIFINHVFKNKIWAFISGLILCSSIGYTGWHEARSGDFDVQVSFYMLLYVLSFWLWIEHKNYQYLLIFTVSLILACLTKGIYGTIGLFGLFAYCAEQKKLKQLVKSMPIYISAMVTSAFVFGYYFYRESIAPGYIDAVLQNEVGERINLETNIHKQDIPFYYHTFKLFVFRYQPYILFLPFALWYGFFKHKNKLVWLCSWCAITIWCVISFSKTKLVWYDGSLYPFLAIILAYWFANLVQQKNTYVKNALFLIIALSYLVTFWLNQTEKNSFDFKDFITEYRKTNNDTLLVYATSFELPTEFYLKQDSINGFKSNITNNLTQINQNNIVTINQTDFTTINNNFTTKTVFKKGNCTLLNIVEPKQ